MVTQTVTVTAAPSPGAAPRRMVKQIQFTRKTNGSFVLTGMATGRTKVVVTRSANGVTSTGKRSVRVRPNTTRSMRIRLRTR